VKNGANVFIAAFIALGASWYGFVLAPAKQLGGEKQTTVLNSTETYPVQRPGDATQGLQVYRANGCAACHTEQVRQDGVACDVVLTGVSKNGQAVSNLVASMNLTGLTKEQADAASDKITAAGGKAETRVIATGSDIERGWGYRQSVAADYLWDESVQLGSLRAGPDLSNVGLRGDVNWMLQHLYAPKSLNKNSVMTPFKYLFDVRKIAGTPSPDALVLPKEFAPAEGYEVVPTEEAKHLAAYLLSLRQNVPLYEAPFTTAKP